MSAYLVLSAFIFFSPSHLIARRTKIGHMLGSKCDLKTHVQNLGIPSPYKSGAQNHLFRRFRNWTAILTAYIFGMKHYVHNRASALETAIKSSPIRPLIDDPSFLYKKLVRETWSKKLGYTSRTQNHPSFSYGKHGGRQRWRFSCSYKSVAIVFHSLNDRITQLNSTNNIQETKMTIVKMGTAVNCTV